MSTFSAKMATIAGLCAIAGGLAFPAKATHRCVDYGLKPVDLYSNGTTVQTFVSNLRAGRVSVSDLRPLRAEEQDQTVTVASFIRLLGIVELKEPELAVLLQQMRKSPGQLAYEYPIPRALQGIGGLPTTLLLQWLIFIDGRPIAKPVLYGKIRDYTFIDQTKSGHINIDTCIDDLQTGQREFFHWDVEIANNGFEVTERNDDQTDDPFSLLPEFQMPPGALDRNNRHSIWHRGLTYKLGAKGYSITVRHVYHRVLSNAIIQTLDLLERPDPTDPLDPAHRFYTSTPDSCIDLFTRGYPPATFNELAGNDYCLGRCSFPAIYNSGE